MKIHPAAELFPLVEGEDFARLVADIKENGQQVPIVVTTEGELLDGRNRLRACEELGIFPTRETYEGDDPVGFVVSLNVHRRHLNESQRAMVAAKLANMPQGRPETNAQICAINQEEAAEMLSVARRSVQSAKKVRDKAEPEVVALVEQGKLSVSLAEKVSEKPKEQQIELVEQIKAGKNSSKAAKSVIKEAKEKRKAPGSYIAPTMFVSDIANAAIEPGSIDYIITDPPYPKEFLPLYSTLSEKAALWLKPGGSLIVMSGQSYIPEVVSRLCECMNYHWMAAYLMPGQGAQMFDRSVNPFWKPLLWFVKGKYSGDWIGDVLQSKENDKDHHHWGQSESGMADIITRWTDAGDTILDPFLGGGTTVIVAAELGREAIGFDIDESCVATALARLPDVG